MWRTTGMQYACEGGPPSQRSFAALRDPQWKRCYWQHTAQRPPPPHNQSVSNCIAFYDCAEMQSTHVHRVWICGQRGSGLLHAFVPPPLQGMTADDQFDSFHWQGEMLQLLRPGNINSDLSLLRPAAFLYWTNRNVPTYLPCAQDRQSPGLFLQGMPPQSHAASLQTRALCP